MFSVGAAAAWRTQIQMLHANSNTYSSGFTFIFKRACIWSMRASSGACGARGRAESRLLFGATLSGPGRASSARPSECSLARWLTGFTAT
jgi:hypothetical protein